MSACMDAWMYGCTDGHMEDELWIFHDTCMQYTANLVGVEQKVSGEEEKREGPHHHEHQHGERSHQPHHDRVHFLDPSSLKFISN